MPQVFGYAHIRDENSIAGRWGVIGATAITFFLAQMGDKTQIATVALAARYSNVLLVVVTLLSVTIFA